MVFFIFHLLDFSLFVLPHFILEALAKRNPRITCNRGFYLTVTNNAFFHCRGLASVEYRLAKGSGHAYL